MLQLSLRRLMCGILATQATSAKWRGSLYSSAADPRYSQKQGTDLLKKGFFEYR